jgi:uncharacterized protein DUF4124
MNPRYRIPLTGALALAACLVLLPPDPASAETYQWTDKNGNVGFTDSLENVPPQYRQSAKRVEGKESTKPLQVVPSPPGRDNTMPPAQTDQDDLNATWRQRMIAARAELEELKAKRQKAQKEYDDLLRYRRFWSLRLHRTDPIEDAKILSKLNELDQQVREKEQELTVTIPDEARRAGVPPGVLSQ